MQAKYLILMCLTIARTSSAAQRIPNVQQRYSTHWTIDTNDLVKYDVYADDVRTVVTLMSCRPSVPPARLDCSLNSTVFTYDGFKEYKFCGLTLLASENYLINEVRTKLSALPTGNVIVSSGEVLSTDWKGNFSHAVDETVTFYKMHLLDMNTCKRLKADMLVKTRDSEIFIKVYKDSFDVAVTSNLPDCIKGKCVNSYELDGGKMRRIPNFIHFIPESSRWLKYSNKVYYDTDLGDRFVVTLVKSNGEFVTDYAFNKTLNQSVSFSLSNRMVTLCKHEKGQKPNASSSNYFDYTPKFSAVAECLVFNEHLNLTHRASFVMNTVYDVPQYEFVNVSKYDEDGESESVLAEFGSPDKKSSYRDGFNFYLYDIQNHFCFSYLYAEDSKYYPNSPESGIVNKKNVYHDVKCIVKSPM